MNKFRFLSWQVYKDAQDLLQIIIDIVKQLPKEYRFEIGSQLIRASLSIVLNIAEGSGRRSDSEMNRFFNIAIGSLYEVLAAADTLNRFQLITKFQLETVYKKIDTIDNQLGGFKKKLKIKSSKL